MYLFVVQPYSELFKLKMEIFSQITSFTILIFLNAFVGNTYNPDEKYYLGWYVSALFLIFIFTHLTVIFGGTICGLVNSGKALVDKCKQKCKKNKQETEAIVAEPIQPNLLEPVEEESVESSQEEEEFKVQLMKSSENSMFAVVAH